MRHAAHNPLPHVPGPQEASAAGGQTLHLTAFIANQVCVLLGIASFTFLANNKQKADLSYISSEALLELREELARQGSKLLPLKWKLQRRCLH